MSLTVALVFFFFQAEDGIRDIGWTGVQTCALPICQVGTGSANGGGSAGVAITAGTPQDFTSRDVGVELRVTPTVEEDDYSISLDLNPRVTEFDGFVEFGGPSIAISGGTTVTVPSGFFQPIFSVRDISTKVTIWDGATLVMGGLTREEVKKVT